MNFAGIFLGLLLLGTGAAGFVVSSRVNALARPAGDSALGFEGAPGGALALAASEATYVAVETEPSSPAHRALSLLWLAILVAAVAAFSAFVVWEIGSWIVHIFLTQFAGD